MPSVVTMNWSGVPGVALCIFSSGRLSAKFEMDPRHRLPAALSKNTRLSKDTRMSGTSLVQQASFLSPGCSLAPLTKQGPDNPAGLTNLVSIFGHRVGAACVTRTRDPIITNDVLYQLS